jgi:hypothetical protein
MVPGGAFCLWKVPKSYTKDDFQKMVDAFIGPCCKNSPVWMMEPSYSLGASNLHTDFYLQDAIGYANMVAGETEEKKEDS